MMLFHAYLRRKIVYIPTVAKRETGAYTDIEPVAVAAITDVDGNIVVPRPPDKYPQPILLKYANVKTWAAFACGTLIWSIEVDDGKYQIVGYRRYAKGYWEEDPAQTIQLAPGTSVHEVINRMIAILQNAAATADN